MLLVGGGDELGTYDDSQFQENDEAKKKIKGNNIIRNQTSSLIFCRFTLLAAYCPQVSHPGLGPARRP